MAKAKQKPLTCTFYIGGKQVERLTEEQLEIISQRLSTAMSAYYTAHPEEYIKIKDKE
jgi:hypothetical protein